jgi:hypothetical protein
VSPESGLTTTRSAAPTDKPSRSPDTPADGYAWAGGPETGLRVGIPSDWVEYDAQSDDLERRHGFNAIDPIGAEDPEHYEGHLLASCGPNPGLNSHEDLERAAPSHYSQYKNTEIDSVTHNGAMYLRIEYDDQLTSGTLEHWYNYNFLANSDRLCSISIVTPLPEGKRSHIKEIFERIGTTIDPLDPPT